MLYVVGPVVHVIRGNEWLGISGSWMGFINRVYKMTFICTDYREYLLASHITIIKKEVEYIIINKMLLRSLSTGFTPSCSSGLSALGARTSRSSSSVSRILPWALNHNPRWSWSCSWFYGWGWGYDQQSYRAFSSNKDDSIPNFRPSFKSKFRA